MFDQERIESRLLYRKFFSYNRTCYLHVVNVTFECDSFDIGVAYLISGEHNDAGPVEERFKMMMEKYYNMKVHMRWINWRDYLFKEAKKINGVEKYYHALTSMVIGSVANPPASTKDLNEVLHRCLLKLVMGSMIQGKAYAASKESQ